MSLTIGAITSGIGSAISGLAEGAVSVIKILASVGFAVIFATVILSLLGLIQNYVMTSVVGEFFALISVCLPFSPAVIFSGLWIILDAILTFLIGRKTYILVSHLIKVSG